MSDEETIEMLDELERTARGAKEMVRQGVMKQMTEQEQAWYENRYGKGRMILGNFVLTRICRSPGIPPEAIYDPNF